MRGLYMESVAIGHKRLEMDRVDYLRLHSDAAKKKSYKEVYEFLSWLDYGCGSRYE